MRMHQVVASMVTLALSASIAFAGGGTAFTYQGRLLDVGEPANGLFDFEFGLWDAANGGNPIGVLQVLNNTPVNDGLFTVQIDFGADAFNNADRWLEISVDGVPLMPRQPITRAPYSIQTRGIVVNDAQHVGMGVNPGAYRLRAWNLTGGAFEAIASGRAVEAISTEGDMAILASNQSVDGMAVFAQHQPSQNQGWIGTPDYGVYGRANDVDNDWAGYFFGRAHVSNTLFVGREDPITSNEFFGFNAPVGDDTFGGMYISTNAETAWPFYGYAAGGTFDMWHYYDGGTQKWHLVNNGNRLTVQSNGNVGIGTTGPTSRLHVVSSSGFNPALLAQSSGYDGVVGTTGVSGRSGVYGECGLDVDGYGVFGRNNRTFAQIWGYVGGISYGAEGVNEDTLKGEWAAGQLARGSGVGVWGGTSLGNSGIAGLFAGNVEVTGTLFKGAGGFKIDHPLDPDQKNLTHSFIESPDMMNVYNDNITTDDDGYAVVTLPDWFEALNRDFRYQLTVIGQFAQAIVAEEIQNNQFAIRTDKPNVKVSWQVTGIRQDPFANTYRIPVEQYKPDDERGKFLHPEVYGQPAEAGVNYSSPPTLPGGEEKLASAEVERATNSTGGSR